MKILNYKKFGNGEKKLIFLHELMEIAQIMKIV